MDRHRPRIWQCSRCPISDFDFREHFSMWWPLKLLFERKFNGRNLFYLSLSPRLSPFCRSVDCRCRCRCVCGCDENWQPLIKWSRRIDSTERRICYVTPCQLNEFIIQVDEIKTTFSCGCRRVPGPKPTFCFESKRQTKKNLEPIFYYISFFVAGWPFGEPFPDDQKGKPPTRPTTAAAKPIQSLINSREIERNVISQRAAGKTP